ncbi:MAG: nucleotide exchange factor GrpE [Peptococcaceae bacterium]|nr:nucleotide exchange factor GrpE [Peptococcaceae bacterium]
MTNNEVEDLQESQAGNAEESMDIPAKDSGTLELKAELDEYKSKAEDYYSQLQRLKAEFDNFRKRTQKEKEEAAKYGSERIILSLLPVLDNFERAVESSHKNKDFESLSQGVEMIHRQFLKVLEDEGLKTIQAAGEQFDPNLHEALLREETDQGENVVLEELQKGYYLKDKVLRPSRVKVSG